MGWSTTSTPGSSLPRTARRSAKKIVGDQGPDRDPGHHVPGTRTTGGGSAVGKTTEVLKGPPKVYAPAGAQPSARSVVKTLLDEDTSPRDLPTLTEKLGIPFSKVDHFYQTQVDISDPLVKNFFEYELGTAQPVIKNRYRSAYEYWKNVLKAPQQVLDWIQFGIKIEFLVHPRRIYVKNNKSAKDNPKFVTKAVKELLDAGLVKKVKEIPYCVNALSVAYNAAGKPRLCLDMSHVNNHIDAPSFKLDDQRTWFEVCKTGIAVQWVFDFKSCYHQMMLNEDHTVYFGFAWPDEDGNVVYYVFVVMPFGYIKAPYICKHFFRPLIKRWRKMSIPTCLFYDDCISGAHSKEAGKMFSDRQRIDLLESHVLVNPAKSDFTPSPSVVWLGHKFDVGEGTVSITEERVERVTKKILTLEQKWPKVAARDLAKVVGSVISASLVFPQESQFMTRFLQAAVNHREERRYKWSQEFDVGETEVADLAKTELMFWKKVIVEKNSRRFTMERKSCRLVWGDAGDRGEGAHFDFGDGEKVVYSSYDSEQSESSSTERELSCIHSLLLSVPHLLANKEIVYVTDSLSCHIIMGKGSRRRNLHIIAAACRGLARAINTQLHTAWVPREFNQRADDISKQQDFDDWFLTQEMFERVEKLNGEKFTVDAFADNRNTKVQKFFSKYWCPGTTGVDGLAQDWSKEVVLAVPPPAVLLQTLVKFQEDRSRGMIVFPDCGVGLLESAWSSKILKKGKLAEWRFKGSGRLGANVSTRYNERFEGKLVLVKVNFQN